MKKILIKILIVLVIILFIVSAVAYYKNSRKDSGGSIPGDITNGVTNEEINHDASDNHDAADNPEATDNKLPDDISATPSPAPEESDSRSEPIVLAFAGDVNLDDNAKTVARYDRENKGINGVISGELIDEMNNADIFMLNNEFAFSTRGTKIEGKSYTFRANPERVDILKEMGTDIVSLANNHALDYGVDALLDTFTTLEEAGIDYVGAGRNMDRAKTPIYRTIGDTTIAFLAASRVIYAVDWYATNERPGMLGTYDPSIFVKSIKEAKENSDFVVVFVHWGVENVHEPVDHQKELAKIYIDAGADAVIGCHPHVMQGIEFYNGKPIAYSLGNYWFNSSKRESGLLKLYLNPDQAVDIQLLPVMNESAYTYLITDDNEKKAYYDFMKNISFNAEFDSDGFVTPKN